MFSFFTRLKIAINAFKLRMLKIHFFNLEKNNKDVTNALNFFIRFS